MAKFRAYLQLVRIPAVFTAMADIFLGFLMMHGTLLIDGCPLPFTLLLLSSSCLYLAGMTFNDVFDRKIDAVERPRRPIPSGRIPVKSAVVLGSALILSGVGAAAIVGMNSLLVSLVLTAAIFLYDGVLKSTVAGPLVMGSCRVLNVLLGASAVADIAPLASPPVICVALGLGVYIIGVTWFARDEAVTSSRSQLVFAAVLVNAALISLFWLAVDSGSSGFGGHVAVLRLIFPFAVIALVLNRSLFLAIGDPKPVYVQRGVKTLLQWLIVLDATLVFAETGDPIYAAVTAVLLLPAMFLGRWVFVT